MTVDEARAVLLGFDGAEEGAHHGHPDFRVGGKIFATLWPSQGRSVLRLKPERAEAVDGGDPGAFRIVSRANGYWLSVQLEHIEVEDFRALAEAACRYRT